MEESILNKNMVDGQIKPINGMSAKLLAIFYSLNRSDFVPDDMKEMSYIEKNLLIENNRIILKPELIAKIAISIDLQSDENVLILGSSSGYLTAILSHQAETVIVVEENDHLLMNAENAIKKNNINNVIFFKNEIIKGYTDQSPFNAIIIEGAVETVPLNILNQLDEGGRLLAIISEQNICSAKIFKKVGDNYNEQRLFNCSLPSLDVFKEKKIFSF